MKISRRDLRATLERAGRQPAPAPDSTFVDALERRLVGREAAAPRPSNVVPFRRRTRPLVGVAAAGVAVFAGSLIAVAAPWHQHEPDRVKAVVPATEPAASTSTVVVTTTTTVAPSTTVAPTGGAPGPTTAAVATTPATTAETMPGSTSPATTRPAPATTAAPRATSTTAAPAPAPTTSAVTVAPTTTEITVPAVLSLSCSVVAANSIRCTWSHSSDPTVTSYAVLRGQPAGGSGRVFTTGPGDSSYTDTTASSATDYSYAVHAMRADGNSAAHSGLVVIHCCEAPATTTSTTRV